MNRYIWLASVLLLTSHATNSLAKTASQDGTGAYVTGKYRNLLAEDGHKQNEIQAKVDIAYQQLFHGDPQTQSIAYAAGTNANGPLMYVTDVANHDVRSEGMSYGMMIAVQLGKKEDFDAIWNWAKTYMYVADPKHPSYGYFSWSCKTDGPPNEETPAPDGEEYFAMALLFAGNRWPGGHDIYDYHAQALKILTSMRHREVITGLTKFGERSVGAQVNAEHAMILFVPAVMPQPFTDPSYHLPAFYELWARWGPEADKPFWAHAADVSREFFVKTTHPGTGLSPAYANFDGTPRPTPFFNQSHVFSFDSWRTASNWSVDWSWWHKAPAEQQLSDRIQHFFVVQGLDKYLQLYNLDGTPFGTPQADPKPSPGLIGTNAVTGLAATDRAVAKQFDDALWNTPIPSGQYRYYDGLLYLMSMMHVSGEFRIWGPQ